MPSRNEHHIIGHAGKDVELRYTPNNKAVADISIATNFKFGKTDKTEWHRVVVWNIWAEFAAENIKKGDLVYVIGRKETQKWKDKDGNDRYTVQTIADEVYKLIYPDFSQLKDKTPQEQTQDQAQEQAPPEDDLPF